MQCDILNVCVSAAFGLYCNISAYWITEKVIWKMYAPQVGVGHIFASVLDKAPGRMK